MELNLRSLGGKLGLSKPVVVSGDGGQTNDIIFSAG